jgi:2-keto-4-pentenoate hydratase/2-oxohepta-3-ene-1,7-dioic acid hydratase in catechol pathway
MRFVTYRLGQAEARLGLQHQGLVIDVAAFAQGLPSTMLELIDLGPLALAVLRSAVDAATSIDLVGCSVPEGNVTLLAPIPRPRKNIFGIGLNYTKHVAESARALDTADSLPKQPVIFSKPPTAVVSWNDPIRHNAKITQQLDWETELAVVIGQTARHVDAADALNYVFGYTVINDVSARDCRRAGQWIVSKGQDSFAPMGPCIVTRDDIADPQTLNLWTKVNGIEKQNSNTSFMLFNVSQLIADISSVMTLEPGDIIATGTPEGVGAGRDPQEFMWPGDVVECHVECIGTLRNPVVAV